MKPAAATAKAYARALWELASERGQAAAVAGELAAAVALIEGSAQLRGVLERPWIGAADKSALAAAAAERLGLSPLVRDFLALVARRGRIAALPAIGTAFTALEDAAAGRVRARVRTAVVLEAAERGALEAALGRALGAARVVVEDTVDGELLGGFVADVGGFRVDGSLDGQLARLGARLGRG